jgi:hypothetical protein
LSDEACSLQELVDTAQLRLMDDPFFYGMFHDNELTLRDDDELNRLGKRR